MVSPQFSGPAVDGPCKGQIIVCLSNIYRIVKSIRNVGIYDVSSESLDVVTGFYEFDKELKYWKWKGWSHDAR